MQACHLQIDYNVPVTTDRALLHGLKVDLSQCYLMEWISAEQEGTAPMVVTGLF